jgi:uncharacterized membrane protein YhaH (DUF805 family)
VEGGTRNRRYRFWRTRGGFIANIAIGLFVVTQTIASALAGWWLSALAGVIVLFVFGIRPAVAAHRDGELYVTRHNH